MDIRSMHYDFKQKLNKGDSQQYRNLRIPEIDWRLNEAYELYVKAIAQPRVPNHLGFEVNQRTIDDIRTVVKNNVSISSSITVPMMVNEFYSFLLPSDYMFFLSGYAIINKEGCGERKVRIYIKQHDDEHEESSFTQSSFEWREVNGRFVEKELKIFTDTTFKVSKIIINYIRKHDYIHNAQDFLPSGSYKLPDGTLLTGFKNCELPEHTHREIVDIAVLIATGDLQIPDYQIKQAKLNLNQIN